MMRTHICGELRPADAGQEVTVCGWVASRREHGKHLAFVDVRDHTGVIQCVVDGAHELRSEYVVCARGTVRLRPEATTNPNLATGEVEIGDCRVEVLSKAEPPPFPVTDRVDADEILRLRHRHVDLRRPAMQRNLRLRAVVSSAISRSLGVVPAHGGWHAQEVERRPGTAELRKLRPTRSCGDRAQASGGGAGG